MVWAAAMGGRWRWLTARRCGRVGGKGREGREREGEDADEVSEGERWRCRVAIDWVRKRVW